MSRRVCTFSTMPTVLQVPECVCIEQGEGRRDRCVAYTLPLLLRFFLLSFATACAAYIQRIVLVLYARIFQLVIVVTAV